MRILFLSPVHPLLSPGVPLPKWQMQASWVRALARLGHDVLVVPYTPNDRIRLNWAERGWWNLKVIWSVFQRNSFDGSGGVLSRAARQCHSRTGVSTLKTGSLNGRPILNLSGDVNYGATDGQFPRKRPPSPPPDRNFNLIIYSLGADVLLPWTIRYLASTVKAPLVVLSGVSPLRQGNSRERATAQWIDLAAVNDRGQAREWVALGAKRAIVLPISAIDPHLHRERRIGRMRDIDVLFVGTLTPERRKFFARLRTLLPDTVNMVVKEFVWEENYAELMSRAKIGINLLRPEMERGANLRTFEIPAFGAMEIAGYCRDEWLSPGNDIEIFKSVREAAELVKKYVRNDKEREKMAERGRKRVMRAHTFDRRAERLMKEIYD